MALRAETKGMQRCAAAAHAIPMRPIQEEPEGRRRFIFDERANDNAAVDSHRQSNHFKTSGEAAGSAAAGPSLIVRTLAVNVAA